MKLLFNHTIAIMLCLFISSSFVMAQETDGYDVNTEVKLSGRVTTISDGMLGPIIVNVQSANRTFAIYTGPSWFWSAARTGIRENTPVEVTGSKMTVRDGSIRIICLKMKNLESGKTITFRDDSLMPLWRSGGKKGSYGNRWGGRR